LARLVTYPIALFWPCIRSGTHSRAMEVGGGGVSFLVNSGDYLDGRMSIGSDIWTTGQVGWFQGTCLVLNVSNVEWIENSG